MGNYRPFTLEEREFLEKKLKEGFTVTSIAKATQRSLQTIFEEIRKNGGRGEYNAIEAHGKIKRKEKEIKIDLSEIPRKKENLVATYGDRGTFLIKQRLNELEEQITILHEAIRRLVNDSQN